MRGVNWITGAIVAACVMPLLAQTSGDPATGTWKLNMAKSTLPAAMGIKGMTRVYTSAADGVTLTETQDLTKGGTNVVKYHFRYDGKDYPVTGSSYYDSLAVKELARGKTESTMKLKGEVVGHSAREVSKDGKSMSLTSTLKIAGKDTAIKYEFDKQ